MAGPMETVAKLRKIFHPGVTKDGSRKYSDGALAIDPNERPGPSNDPSGSRYGAAEGVDTRANQFEHDMKLELGQKGAKAETRRGLGTDWTAAPGGIGEGMDTRTTAFERELREDMAMGYVQEGRRGSTAASAEAGRRASLAWSSVSSQGGQGPPGALKGATREKHEFDKGYSLTPIASAVEPGSSKDGAGAAAAAEERDHGITPVPTRVDEEGAKEGSHSDTARVGDGPHATRAANVLDPAVA